MFPYLQGGIGFLFTAIFTRDGSAAEQGGCTNLVFEICNMDLSPRLVFYWSYPVQVLCSR
jgi:hypothetical protein